MGGRWKHHIGREAFGYRSARRPDKHDAVMGLRMARNVTYSASGEISAVMPGPA
jgi:hypothetical protein